MTLLLCGMHCWIPLKRAISIACPTHTYFLRHRVSIPFLTSCCDESFTRNLWWLCSIWEWIAYPTKAQCSSDPLALARAGLRWQCWWRSSRHLRRTGRSVVFFDSPSKRAYVFGKHRCVCINSMMHAWGSRQRYCVDLRRHRMRQLPSIDHVRLSVSRLFNA